MGDKFTGFEVGMLKQVVSHGEDHRRAFLLGIRMGTEKKVILVVDLAAGKTGGIIGKVAGLGRLGGQAAMREFEWKQTEGSKRAMDAREEREREVSGGSNGGVTAEHCNVKIR